MTGYQTIYADPPWEQGMSGKYKKHSALAGLEYPTMAIEQIKSLPVDNISEVGCHLWLWTTNQFLRQGFDVMESWGFKYLAPITWVKDSGIGNYFVHRTQTVLFGYKGKCRFPLARYQPTVFIANHPTKHSQKPETFYDLVESISPEPRVELFARCRRSGWDCWGNEVDSDIDLIGLQKFLLEHKL